MLLTRSRRLPRPEGGRHRASTRPVRRATAVVGAIALIASGVIAGLAAAPTAASAATAATAASMTTTRPATMAATSTDVSASAATARATANTPANGCSFADAGTGKYASTLCWFDLSSVDPAKAATPAGDAMHIGLPGGYSIDMTLTTSGGPTAAVALPTYSAAYLGNTRTGYYTGITGKPALYQTQESTVSDATLSNIHVTDKNGNPVTGYAFVGADAESTDASESITWNSDQPLRQIGDLGNSCGGGFTGANTTSVTCTGTSRVSGDKTGAAILAATNPSTITQHLVGAGKQAVAFGVLVSTVRVDKVVASRAYPGDAFGVQVASGSSALGSGNTGPTATTATTDDVVVLTGDGGETYTLSEAATSGSLADYTNNWVCTRSGTGQWALPSGPGSSKDVTLGVGDFVQCTVTNAALPRSIALTKTSTATADSRPGDTVDYTVTATNTGALPYTNSVPAHIVDDLTGVIDDATYNDDATATVVDGSGTTSYSAPRLHWDGALAVGGTVTIHYSATLTGAGDRDVRNVAFAPGTPTDPTPDCANGGAGSPVPCAVTDTKLPALALTKTADVKQVDAVGDTVVYTVTAKNVGPGAYTSTAPATIIDDLSGVLDDATLDVSSIASSTGSASYTKPSITWGGALAAGDSVTLTYSVAYTGKGDHELTNIVFAPTPGGSQTTPACEGGTGTDQGTGEPCARVDVPASDLIASKSVDPASGTAVSAGETLTYTLRFENAGTAPATVDHVDDLTRVLDDATIARAPAASDPSLTVSALDNGRYTVTGTVAPGAVVTVTYAVTVSAWEAQGDHVLTNFLLAAGEQPPTDGTCAPDSTTCTTNPDPQTPVPTPSPTPTPGTGPGTPGAGDASGGLAHTGSDVVSGGLVALALLLIGGVLVIFRRFRKTA